MKLALGLSPAAAARLRTAIRFVVGGLFVYAGLAKTMDPHPFLRAIGSFRIVPATLIGPLAIVLPSLEVLAGGAWILNRAPRAAAIIIQALSVVFLAALGTAILRGVPADCGCFAALGAGAGSLGMAFARDVVLATGTAWWLFTEPGAHHPEPE